MNRSMMIAGLLVAFACSPLAARQSSPEGFQLRSADGTLALRLRGGIQVDGRWFPEHDVPAHNWFLARRSRVDLNGTLFRDYQFRMHVDLAQSRVDLLDAYVDAPLIAGIRMRAGKQKAPVGLERLQSPWTVAFAERGLPTQLAPNRETGVVLHGTWRGGALAVAGGLVNGVTNGSSDDTELADPKDAVGRIFIRPFAQHRSAPDIGVGIAATIGDQRGTAATPLLASHATSIGRESFFRFRSDASAANTAIAVGTRARVAPQAHIYAGPFGFMAEFTSTRQEIALNGVTDDIAIAAWQATTSWVITGERASYAGVRPVVTDAVRQHGALEVALRFESLSIDDDAFPRFANPATAMQAAHSLIGGINWYVNPAVRATLNYARTTFDAAAAGTPRPDENVVLTRFQVAF